MDKTIARILSQEMTRREFIMKVGLLFLTVIGINGLLKALSRPTQHREQSSGFGSGPYGK